MKNAQETATEVMAQMAGNMPNVGFPMMVVGGFVRDAALGVPSNDVDFAVMAPSFDAMVDAVVDAGGEVFVTTPDTFTCRATFPKMPTFDFVMARVDGPTTEGNRRPDFVTPGTFRDDSDRRDFTVNSMGVDCATGEFHDPNDGMADLVTMTLRFVGDAEKRVREDSLRVMRAFRFSVCKGFTMTPETFAACTSEASAELLGTLSRDRVRKEVEAMMHFDTVATLELFESLPRVTKEAMFRDGLRLSATCATNRKGA